MFILCSFGIEQITNKPIKNDEQESSVLRCNKLNEKFSDCHNHKTQPTHDFKRER